MTFITDQQPLVSVLIPTYQGEEFLEEALESVLSQTYHNLEIIISDDGSVDRTL
jgi:glycosyltransferase involved in cell wall biosynthesis